MAQAGGLLAVFAHPDDEVWGPGGTLAHYADHGIRVTLVCATKGDAGEIAPGVDATSSTLAHVREGELREACAILGIEAPIFLDYRDSGMAETPENRHPGSLYMAPLEAVAARVEREMLRMRPRVVITFDPSGGYGHPDHIAIHKATVRAYDQLTSTANGRDYRPEKLYYVVFSREKMRRLVAELNARHIQSSLLTRRDPNTMGAPDDQIHAEIDTARYTRRKIAARLAHRSQLSPTSPWATLPPEFMDTLLDREYFVRARPEATANVKVHDLFV